MKSLFATVLLAGAMCVAQTSTDQNSNSTQGCLSGSNGSYSLRDNSGASFTLTGDTASLKEHLGHTVKITGTKDTSSNSIKVDSVAMVSESCSTSSASSQPMTDEQPPIAYTGDNSQKVPTASDAEKPSVSTSDTQTASGNIANADPNRGEVAASQQPSSTQSSSTAVTSTDQASTTASTSTEQPASEQSMPTTDQPPIAHTGTEPGQQAATTDQTASTTSTDANATAMNQQQTTTDQATTTQPANDTTGAPVTTDTTTTASNTSNDNFYGQSSTSQNPSTTTDQSATSTQSTTTDQNAATDQTATQSNTQEQNTEQSTANSQLPQTASPLPLLGLLGFGSLITGWFVRRK